MATLTRALAYAATVATLFSVTPAVAQQSGFGFGVGVGVVEVEREVSVTLTERETYRHMYVSPFQGGGWHCGTHPSWCLTGPIRPVVPGRPIILPGFSYPWPSPCPFEGWCPDFFVPAPFQHR